MSAVAALEMLFTPDDAAHDPALGLDRSVCLRDVVEALNRLGLRQPSAIADLIEREFGGRDG